MKKLGLFLVLSFFCLAVYAKPVVHKYMDRATGKVMGFAWSGENGDPAIRNPEWRVEVVSPSEIPLILAQQKEQARLEKIAVEEAAAAARAEEIRFAVEKAINATKEK